MTASTNKIHLFRSLERADEFAKEQALSGNCLGHKFTTPLNFILDLYKAIDAEGELIDEIERLAFVVSLVSSIEDEKSYIYFAKPNNLAFLISFIKKVAGLDVFKMAEEVGKFKRKDFSPLETEAIRLAEEYSQTISAFKLTEMIEVANLVAREFQGKFDITFEDDCFCDFAVLGCIKRLAKEAPHFAFDGDNFADTHFSKLNYSLFSLSEVKAKIAVFEEILRSPEISGKIAIVTDDVEQDAASLANLAANLDVDVRIERMERQKFKDSLVGQALCACEATQDPGPDFEIALSDFIHNRISGVSVFDSFEKEKELRRNPGVSRETVEKATAETSATYKRFASMALDSSSCDENQFFKGIEEFIFNEKSLSDFEKQEADSHLFLFKLLLEKLREIGYDDALDTTYLSVLELGVNHVFGSDDAKPQISVMPPSSLNKLCQGSFDTVVFCDTSCASFNAGTKFDALRTMLGKIGIKESHSASMTSRINFTSGILASKKDVIFCLPERDLRSGEGLTPSFVLQEFFLNHANIELDTSRIKEQCEMAGIEHKIFGEENLALIGNCETSDQSEEAKRNVTPLAFELKTCKDISNFLRHTEDGTDIIMSPSEIESLCQCPHKWFYERRIAPNTLDFEYNQVEKGNAVHRAFKLFYDELYAKGIYRLSSAVEVADNRLLFLECFHRAIKESFCAGDGELGKDSKINNFLDVFDLSRASGNCLASLAMQANMPARYVVAESEMRIDPDKNVKYAGVVIDGTIDRLDVSKEDNSFVVIDYKGSIKDHGCGISHKVLEVSDILDVPLPSKIQTLIYSSCIRKLTGKKCDAALYFSYNMPKKRVSPATGAVDFKLATDFMFVCGDAKNCSVDMDMNDYLDATEERVAMRIERLLNGDISPEPCNKKACEFCTVSNCPARWSV